MKIAHTTFSLLQFPLERRYGDANGLKSQRATVLIRIETSDGLIGWGESFGYRPKTRNWQAAADILSGRDPLRSNALVDQIAAFDLSLAGGIDIALWDLRGKAANQSISDLLGGPYREAQPSYASLQNVVEQDDVTASAINEAARAMDLGFTSLKMKVGWHPVQTDIDWVNAVIDTLPPSACLAVDANRAMDLATARHFIAGIKHRHRLSWFEEPLANTHVKPHAELRQSIGVPVAGAESMPAERIGEVLKMRAMDYINPDLVGIGGFSRLHRLWAVADEAGVRLVPHVFDGQLVRAATLHFLASRPGWPEAQSSYRAAPLEYDISVNPLRDDLLLEPLRPDAGGCVPVPTGPGLGVEINEDLVARYTVDST